MMSDHDLLITLVAGQEELKKDVRRINGSIASALTELGGTGGHDSVRHRLHKLESDKHALTLLEEARHGRIQARRVKWGMLAAALGSGAAAATIVLHLLGYHA